MTFKSRKNKPHQWTEASLEPWQKSMMGFFEKQWTTYGVFCKNNQLFLQKCSIIDVWQGPKYASKNYFAKFAEQLRFICKSNNKTKSYHDKVSGF